MACTCTDLMPEAINGMYNGMAGHQSALIIIIHDDGLCKICGCHKNRTSTVLSIQPSFMG